MELKPWEFEQLQPYEFYQMLDGWRVRNDIADNRRKRAESVACYLVAHLLNVSGKTIKGKITTADLTKPLEDKPAARRDKKSDAEELKRAFPNAFPGGE